MSKKTPMNRMVQVQVLCTAHRAESLLHKPSTDVLGCAKTLRLLLVILSRFHFHAFRRPVPLKLPGRCTMRIRRKRKSLRQLYASKLHGVTLEGYPCQANDVRRPGGLRSRSSEILCAVCMPRSGRVTLVTLPSETKGHSLRPSTDPEGLRASARLSLILPGQRAAFPIIKKGRFSSVLCNAYAYAYAHGETRKRRRLRKGDTIPRWLDGEPGTDERHVVRSCPSS